MREHAASIGVSIIHTSGQLSSSSSCHFANFCNISRNIAKSIDVLRPRRILCRKAEGKFLERWGEDETQATFSPPHYFLTLHSTAPLSNDITSELRAHLGFQLISHRYRQPLYIPLVVTPSSPGYIFSSLSCSWNTALSSALAVNLCSCAQLYPCLTLPQLSYSC